MTIRIHLTGRVSLEFDGQEAMRERQFRGRQSRIAFAYLVLERTRPVPKEELAKAVWSDDAPPAWEVALSALVSRLRRLLASPSLRASGASITNEFGQYHLNLPQDAWVDLEFSADALDRAESSLRLGNLSRVLGPAFVAVTIAKRPFLSGSGCHWVEMQQAKLDRQLLRATDCLVKLWTAAGEPALAVELATEAIAYDPYREATYHLLMRAHAAAGHRAEALNIYHRLTKLFNDDLGVLPSPATESLYLDLLG